MRHYVETPKIPEKPEKSTSEQRNSRRKSPGMSLAFVLIVMLIGGALTAAALWIVENATRTTRMAKQNALLYDATQEGIQRGLAILDKLITSFNQENAVKFSPVLETTDRSWDGRGWEDYLIVSADAIKSLLGTPDGVFSIDFIPSGAKELTSIPDNVKVYLQVFTLDYDPSSPSPGGTSMDYVAGMPPNVKAPQIGGLIPEGDESREYPTWSFLIKATAVSITGKNNRVERTSSFGVRMIKILPPASAP